MLLVIPFSASDKHLAPTVQEAFEAFSPGADHELLVIAYPAVKDDALIFQQSIAKHFKNVFLHVLSGDNVFGWPRAMNELFQAAALKARHLLANGGCWLWFEMDTTPLKANWLTALQTIYFADSITAQRENRPMKQFLGQKERALRTFNGELIPEEKAGTIMAPVGIYPHNFAEHAAALIKVIPANNTPFYVTLQWYISKSLQETNLIQNNKDTINYRLEDGKIVSDSQARTPWNIHWNNPINSEPVLVHGCKDGTLLATILGPKEEKVEEPPAMVTPPDVPVTPTAPSRPVPHSYRRKSSWSQERRAEQAAKMRAIQQAKQAAKQNAIV